MIDPNVAPGVSIPAKNGINLEETYALADEITKYSDIIKSADLVEYNPLFDKNNVTKEIATNILNKWIENSKKDLLHSVRQIFLYFLIMCPHTYYFYSLNTFKYLVH